MKQDIRLYLAGQRADLGSDTKILYNYKVTDTQNPSAVKNSFSKSIVLEGTDNNNAIFGNIFDLARLQTYGAGNYSGTDFNPLRKAEFALYVDSELYETGYFKLTLVEKTGNKITYSITLYGGLGEFIYNLSESEGGNKLEFKNLQIVNSDMEPVPDLGFTVSKETVDSAWTGIDSYGSKYATLNFAPCYNGTPDDFDPSHVLVNLHGKPTTLNNLTGISSYNAWATGEASRDMTEWETRDLRSYMQRPVLRVKDLISSCCLPQNNGNYRVDLDEHFFNRNNPYWEDAWVTLPLIKDMQGEDDSTNETTITGATLTKDSGKIEYAYYYTVNTSEDFSDFSNLNLDLSVNMTPNSATTVPALYLSCQKHINNNFTLSTSYVKKSYHYYSTVLLQLVAFDAIGKVVATSSAYELTSGSVSLKEAMSSETVPIPEWKTLFGKFVKSGSTYTWADNDGNPVRINFRFPSATSFHTLKLRIQRPFDEAWRRTGIGGGSTSIKGVWDSHRLWTAISYQLNGNYTETQVRFSDCISCDENLSIDAFAVTASRYGGFLSGKYISQDRILTLGVTPADLLLSYTKLFGLHIFKDPIEKLIYIADRDTYYDTGDIVDLNEFIDRGRAMKITPQVAQSKWYDFSTEQHDSEANSQYKDEYGMDFGLARVNTSYDFDAKNTAVYDGEFKGGVQVLEKGPYYYNDLNSWPVYVYNGFKLTTYAVSGTSLEGTEHTVNTMTGANIYALNGEFSGFDLFDKPQFHEAGNDPADGEMVLLFYNRKIPTTSTTAGEISYWITDDLEEMVSLNDKTPCWIMTEGAQDRQGNTIGIKVSQIPQFSRYIVYDENKFITHTWDFGRTQETYIPGTVLTEGSSIYERCWKDYISDMYDVNSRILACNVLIKGQVSPDWLQRFYHFDNSYWRLNQVKEWNPGSYDTTMCEFLKVNNLENYRLDRITKDPVTDFYLPDWQNTSHEETTNTSSRYYSIPSTVSAVTVNVEVQDGGVWYYGDGPGADYKVEYGNGITYYYPYTSITASHTDSGRGSTSDVFLIDTNHTAYARTFRFNIVIYGQDGDHFYYIYLTQEPVDVGTITIRRFAGSGNVPAAGGTVLLDVISETAWSAELAYTGYTSLNRWYAQSGTTTVVMTVDANTSPDARPCKITCTNLGGSSYTFEVMQNGVGQISQLNFAADTYTFEAASGGTINGSVACPESDGSWQVSQCPAWIVVNPTSGESGMTYVTITASQNTGESRFGEVIVTAGPETDSINFGQRGEEFTGLRLTLEAYDFSGTTGTYSGTVRSSVDGWHFEYSSWITPSIFYGDSGTTNFTFTLAANSTGYGRVGFFRVQAGGYSDEVGVTQDPQ